MTKYKVIETQIKELLIFEPTTDADGFSVETDSKQDLLEIGIGIEFVQESSVKIARGILQGLHFQREQPQGRLVRVVSGSVLYVAIDLRPMSHTYGASSSVEISAENQRIFWIPEQFAHGFLSVESNTEIIFKCTYSENSNDVSGILWSDPILSINWQFERFDIDEKYLKVSDRDKRLPSFRSWNPKTLWK